MTEKRLVPYQFLSPGYEAVYTGETSCEALREEGWPMSRFTDPEGNVYIRWQVWTWMPRQGEVESPAERQAIDRLQADLDILDDETRRLRAHIGSLVLCDSGIPVTIDALLDGIGRGRLPARTFHDGCWVGSMWWDSQSTQPGQPESMAIMEACLLAYLGGEPEQSLAERYPAASGFIHRMVGWLGPRQDLSNVQALLLKRVLLPFDYYTQRRRDYDTANQDYYGEGGRGQQIDQRIAQLAGLPKIYGNHLPAFHAALETIQDPEKQELYRICGALVHGLHELSDCHHSTFRWLENWIHAIGTLRWQMAPRRSGGERQRLARLLFGYTLGLDSWLRGELMQFLLLDLGYVDLGFDPRDEILRVYAYLGEDHSKLKTWLAACLWHNLSGGGNPRGLIIQKELNDRASALGISTRRWMDELLKESAT